MPSRRDQIRMSDEEVRSFLAEQRTLQCATIGPRGWPHLVPLWYVPEGLELLAWTYRKSQKARNLERDPRATVGIEAGEQYHELRGVMMECRVELEYDRAALEEFGLRLFSRYFGTLTDDVRQMVAAQAAKRVGLRFSPVRIASWDHRKLAAGTY
ncbi:hypothetical protein HRbin41_00528 [bacterium HR41]|nr:hypothetical protein HRbin41_00528 [bacterium HR41]